MNPVTVIVAAFAAAAGIGASSAISTAAADAYRAVTALLLRRLGVGEDGRQDLVSPARADLADLADRLAIALGTQWTNEAVRRQVHNPYPMAVQWKPTDASLVESWPKLLTQATSGPGSPVPPAAPWAGDPAGLAGTAGDLVDVLGRVPTGRLLVLGEPGAGKTVLLVRVVLDLLSRRDPGQPVPILLPLASWNPQREDLYTWIEHRLSTDNHALSAPLIKKPRTSRARALLDAGFLLLVLDGLDEIPDRLRGAAIDRINDALPPGQRLIVAARTEAFRRATRPPGGPEVTLNGAAGIELCPLEAGVVTDYLRHSSGGPDSAARWDDVAATLVADPGAPVAQALTTPLIAALARVVYNPRARESPSSVPRHPGELCDRDSFPSRTAVERHLFDAFIPAAYRPGPGESGGRGWNAEQATRWLTFLARDLEHRQHGTTDLAWW
ncbi:MAG TPA: NACHT domain-containing protein, partial [Mycobacteriales bacterium]|nr:NACHT domain-containing protein [Mycobacteriales bacterium]